MFGSARRQGAGMNQESRYKTDEIAASDPNELCWRGRFKRYATSDAREV